MKVQVLGSSHMYSMLRGLVATRNTFKFEYLGEYHFGSRIIVPEHGSWDDYALLPELRTWLEALEADRLLVTISGSDWLNYCLSKREEEFDFILPSRPDLPEIEGARLIPYAEIRAELRLHIRHVVLGLRAISETVSIPITYIEPPPPIEDDAHVGEYAPPGLKLLCQAHGVTKASLRQKMFLLHSEIIREECERSGVEFFALPPELISETGYMRAEHVKDDAMHTNDAYGGVLVRALDNKLSDDVTSLDLRAQVR